jgi:hypothetical protein
MYEFLHSHSTRVRTKNPEKLRAAPKMPEPAPRGQTRIDDRARLAKYAHD